MGAAALSTADLYAEFVEPLRRDKSALTSIKDCFRVGQLRGVFDKSMPAPDVDDSAVILRSGGNGSPLAGFATFWMPHPNFVWIDLLWVEPPWRRHGLGTRLLSSIRAHMPTGYEIGLGTLQGNVPMDRLIASFEMKLHSTQYRLPVRK